MQQSSVIVKNSIDSTRTVSQITNEYLLLPPGIILLHAYPQGVYCYCVKFHQLRRSCAYMASWTHRVISTYALTILFAGCIISLCITLYMTSCFNLF